MRPDSTFFSGYPAMHVRTVRSIWLSDVHLGTRPCRADLLLDFLRRTECEQLYLVGDIVDVERLRRSFYWPASHTEVLKLVLEKARNGTRVVYVPGNHDDELRALAGTRLGPVEIEAQCVHTTADGRRLLILHGDEFDAVIRSSRLAATAGSLAYGALLGLNRFVHGCRSVLGKPYWSLAQNVKMRLGRAVRYVENFQRACLDAAHENDVDGVVCGHIHKAALLERGGLVYCNDGDWVESCTALTEDDTGRLELVAWPQLASDEAPARAELARDAA